MLFKVLPGKPEDIRGLVLRDFDLLELEACCSKTPEEQVKESWEQSDIRWTVWAGDKVACVLGCCGKKGKFGVPWLLGTKHSTSIKKVFISDLKDCLRIMLRDYRFLINYVHPGNKQSIRWLEWLGFEIKPAEPFGEFKNLFHPFTMVADV